MKNPDTVTGPGRAGVREWTGLAVLAFPSLLVSIDVSVMLLALPHITAELGASNVQSLWILDIYGFMLAGFMITMGTLGDRVGRRRLLLIGGAAFGVASVLAAFSTGPLMLIGARALLGVAGATLTPSTLALITNMFRDHGQRSLAIGVWMVSFMGGMVVGPVVGGTLLEFYGWGSVFLIAVPVMVLLLVTAPFLLPEYRDENAGRIDLLSVALSLAAILPVIYGLKEVAAQGAEPVPILAVAVGIAFAVAFVRRQQRLAEPLLDLTLFGNRTFRAAILGMFGITITGATMLYITQYLQLVEGLSPLQAGLWMLPGVAASVVGFIVSPLIARRVRPAHLIAGGMFICILGALVIAQAAVAYGLAAVVAGFVLFNLGGAPMPTLGTDLVVGSVPPQKAGSAAATSETSAELGFGLGIALLGSLGTLIFRTSLADSLPAGLSAQEATAAAGSLSGALVVAESLPQLPAAQLVESAVSAFLTGFQVVTVFAAVALLGVAWVALTQLRHVPPIGQEAPEPAAAGEPILAPLELAGAGLAAETPISPVVRAEPVQVLDE